MSLYTEKEYYKGSKVLEELHLNNLMLKEHRPNTLSPEGTPHMRTDVKSEYKIRGLIGNWQEKDQKFLENFLKAILGKKTRIEEVAGCENAYLYENGMGSMNAGVQQELLHEWSIAK